MKRKRQDVEDDPLATLMWRWFTKLAKRITGEGDEEDVVAAKKQQQDSVFKFEEEEKLVGFKNLGNTCYMNSVLQVLRHCSHFVEVLRAGQMLHEKEACLGPEECTYCLLLQVVNEKESYLEPSSSLISCLRKGQTEKNLNQQEDAHEYLMLLLEQLADLDPSKEIERLFSGILDISNMCTVCRVKSVVLEPFKHLSLDISSDSVFSVDDALRNAFSSETLHQKNAYQCQLCQVPVRAVRETMLKQLPKILVLHLKRFRWDQTKLNKHVEFGPFLHITMRSGRTRIMRLFAVLVHIGHYSNSGHYVVYIFSNDKWFRADDSFIREASWEEVSDQNAYILFYQMLQSPRRSSPIPIQYDI